MKLVIPSNMQPDLVDRVRGPKAHSLYAALPTSFVGGSRPPLLIPPVSRRKLKAHIAQCHEAKLLFNYVLNAPCLNNREFTRKGQRQLHRLLRWIDDSGADSVTVSIPFLLQIIKRHYPRLKVTVSTVADVSDSRRARYWQDLGADCINISVVGVGRSFKTMASIRRAVDIDLQVIGNLTCTYQCPYFQYHGVTEGHSAQIGHPLHGFLIDYSRLSCVSLKLNDPAQWVRAAWIRPEDQAVYEDLGINRLKLVNRSMTTDDIGSIVDSYREGRFDGNIFDLLDFPPKPTVASRGLSGKLRLLRYFARPLLVNVFKLKRAAQGQKGEQGFFLDNRDLDGFIDRFVSEDCSERDCPECRYCDEVAERFLRVDPEAHALFEKQTSQVLEGLVSGDLFRWGFAGTSDRDRRVIEKPGSPPTGHEYSGSDSSQVQ